MAFGCRTSARFLHDVEARLLRDELSQQEITALLNLLLVLTEQDCRQRCGANVMNRAEHQYIDRATGNVRARASAGRLA